MPLNLTKGIETNMGPNALVAILLLTLLIFVGVYDAVAVLFYGHSYTISWVVKSWARNFPILTVLIGMVLGHLFWPVGNEEETTPTQTLHNGHSLPTVEPPRKSGP